MRSLQSPTPSSIEALGRTKEIPIFADEVQPMFRNVEKFVSVQRHIDYEM
jgi:hypothetical protein